MIIKKGIEDLAVFGGRPAFADKLHVGQPNICDRQRLQRRIDDLLDRRRLSNKGPYVLEFERKVADITGAKHCIALCNGTAALEVAARAVGLAGEVIMPAFTFVATAHALKWIGIRPVFCDIDPFSHNIDPGRVEGLITPQTSGIIGVHLWGRPCDIEALDSIAKQRGIGLIFDAAHAFYTSYKGRMIGQFGSAGILSFHATKFINTMEGGAIVTNDDGIAARVRLMKNFGFAGYDNVVSIGTNAKMNEISAAMGLTALEDIDRLIDINKRNYRRYESGLSGIDGVTFMRYNESEKCNYQYIVVEIDDDSTRISRDLLVSILKAENVLARRYFYPGCHRMEPYRSDASYAGLRLPETDMVSGRVISLPTGASVGPEKIDMICAVMRSAVSDGAKIAARLSGAGQQKNAS